MTNYTRTDRSRQTEPSFTVPLSQRATNTTEQNKIGRKDNLVPEEHQELVVKLKQEVNTLFLQIQDNFGVSFQHTFYIGEKLTRAKELIPHGNWEPWLKREFPASKRSAQHCMAVYKKLGEKYETLSRLEPTALYLLAAKSTPDAAITEVEQRIQAGEKLSTKDIRKLIKQYKSPVQPKVLKEPRLRLCQALKELRELIDEQILEDIENVLGPDEAKKLCHIRTDIEKMLLGIEGTGQRSTNTSSLMANKAETMGDDQTRNLSEVHSASDNFDFRLSNQPKNVNLLDGIESSCNKVDLGCIVSFKEIISDSNATEEYNGEYEIVEKADNPGGKCISVDAPLAKALCGNKVGNIVPFAGPDGRETQYLITQIMPQSKR